MGTLKADLEAWRTRPLAEFDVFGLHLDAIALRARSAAKVVSLPVLAVVAIRTDGQRTLVALECCSGESFEAWRGLVDDLGARGLPAPVVCVIADFHRIGYAENLGAARGAFTAFESKRRTRWPGIVRSLQEGGEELLTFFQFPASQRKTRQIPAILREDHRPAA